MTHQEPPHRILHIPEFTKGLVEARLPRQTNLMMHIQLHARDVMEAEIRTVTGDRSATSPN